MTSGSIHVGDSSMGARQLPPSICCLTNWWSKRVTSGHHMTLGVLQLANKLA